MSGYNSASLPSPEAARALVTGARRECRGCGKPLQGRQKTACSGRCRAKLSRQHREQEVRGCLLVARQAIDLALETIPERGRTLEHAHSNRDSPARAAALPDNGRLVVG